TTPSNFSIRCSPPRPQRYCTSTRPTMAWMHLLPSTSCVTRRPFGLFQEALSLSGVWWRRGRDSNPRYGYPYAAFRVRCFQPLSHLSVAARRKHPVGRRLCIQRETVKQERSVAYATARHERSGARGRQKNLATSVALARGHALPDPPDDQVGDSKVVLVHHQ